MCEVKRCKGDDALNYKGHYICDEHWQKHCQGRIDLNDEKVYK